LYFYPSFIKNNLKVEGDNSENLKKIYREFYIETGKKLGDPWLRSLGHWHLGEYIESLNCITDDIESNEGKAKLGKKAIDWKKKKNNLYYCLSGGVGCKKKEKDEDENAWGFDSPEISAFNPSLITLCKKVEKAYQVLSFNLG
jgi:hypothetical protein